MTLDQLSNHEFKGTQRQEGPSCKNTLHDECGGQPLADRVPISNLAKQTVCETIGPFDGELSKVHDADVHVFSHSLLFLGKHMREIKFTERWKEHLACCKDTAKRVDGEYIQFIFHMFLDSKNERDNAQNR